mmetsp:Transcript_23119/g.33868  ORF Transcript_23119/g.33868 Transcript_23119/m.33868 type:complete len:225 (+) Transcript_23119:58-732(+)
MRMIRALRLAVLQTPRSLFYRAMTSGNYPHHEVVGMPALSPTMVAGTIVSWIKNEGDAVSAGDTIAEVETDKATIGFDAVDDLYIAKLLVEAGSEVTVGAPIMITVESEEDVSKFAGYELPATNSHEAMLPKKEPVPTTSSPPPVISTLPERRDPSSKPSAPSQPTPIVTSASVANSPSTRSASVQPASMWGTYIAKSPLSVKFIRDQKNYVAKYGTCCHNPLG